MKNKYLTKCLCITLASAMILSGTAFASGADNKAFPSENEFSDQSETGGGTAVSSAPVSAEPGALAPSPQESELSGTPQQASSSDHTPTPGGSDASSAAAPDINHPPLAEENHDSAPGGSPETSASPVPSVTPVPGAASAPGVTAEPGTAPGVGEAPELSVTPGPDMSEGPDVSVTPAPGSSGTPAPGVTEDPLTPTPDLSVTPGPDVSVTPGPDLSVTPAPDVSVTPGPNLSVTPAPDLSVTPGPDLSVTPTPDLSVTPTPDLSVTPTPTPGEFSDAVQAVVDQINALALEEITLEMEPLITAIRTAYNNLTEEEQAQVTNYALLVEFEIRIAALKENKAGTVSDGTTVVPNALQGQPVYFTTIPSNLHAGKDFYLNNLKDRYQLAFSDDFAAVMDEVEDEYKAKMKLADASDMRKDGVTSSSDMLLVRNWQDILAIYVYEKQKEGATSFDMNASCKEDLAEIFEELNPVIRDKENITRVSYGNRHINYYIRKNKLNAEERKTLRKYVETDCKLLCATVTAARGFVRESVGDDVSEERVNVISAAYSLVGKVGYFWGGKSTVLGDDPSWGTAATVSAAGSPSTGTLRAYGLDCSGFVTWAVVNGYQNRSMQLSIGDGTSDQWVKANVVSEADAQPGDLVFQRGPEAGSNNHVGIICGKTDAGDWIAVHCSSSKNGVTVGEAYSASFRYIRQPSFYPSQTELAAMEQGSLLVSEKEVVVSNSLQEALKRSVQGQELTDTVETDFVSDVIEVFEEPQVNAGGEFDSTGSAEGFTGEDSVEIFDAQ